MKPPKPARRREKHLQEPARGRAPDPARSATRSAASEPPVTAPARRAAPAPPDLHRSMGNRQYAHLVRAADRVAAGATSPAFEVEATASPAEEQARQVAAAVASSFAPASSPPSPPPSPPPTGGSADTGPAARPLPEPDAALVQRALLGGRALPTGLRIRLEAHLARNLGGVRVHQGPAADAATRALGARAFTVGSDIVVGARAPALTSPGGLRLMAHEVTHVLQGPALCGPARIRMDEVYGPDPADAVICLDGPQQAPIDEAPSTDVDVELALRRNPHWWQVLDLEPVHPLGTITPQTAPHTFANRVAAMQRAAGAGHLRAYQGERPLAVDGVLGPATLLLLHRLSVSDVPAGDLEPFVVAGADMAALKAAGAAAATAAAVLHHPLVAARWTSVVPADQVLSYYRKRFALNRDDADRLDQLIFGGPAPDGISRDDRHELLALLYGGRPLGSIAAVITINRRTVHPQDFLWVVSHGTQPGGQWSLFFSFGLTSGPAIDAAVAELGLRLPAGHRAAQALDGIRSGAPVPPRHAVVLAYDLPPISAEIRASVVQPYVTQALLAQEERRAQVEEHNRQFARQWADRFAGFVDDKRDLGFLLKMKDLVEAFASRPDVFQYFLDELMGRGRRWFDAFFDALDSLRQFSVHAPAIRLILGTTYATDPRVRESLRMLNSRRQDALRSSYGPLGVNLGRPGGPLLQVDGVAGDVSSMYLRDESLDRITPPRMTELANATKQIVQATFGDILAGRDTRALSQDDLLKEAVGKAATQIKLSDKDVEHDVTYEESVRLRSIRQVTEDGVERSYLTWEVVERWGGSGKWTAVPGIPQESGDDAEFDFRLSLYRLSQITDVVEVAVGVVAFAAIAAIAWEAGLVAVLVNAAGGTAVVLTSIGISELIYVITSYVKGEERTPRGYLFAALDGYLGALAFHRFAPVGKLVEGMFTVGPTTLMRTLVARWLLSRAAVGGLAGAVTGPASLFARDLVEILSGDRRQFSSLGAYFSSAAWGLFLGAAFEIGGSALALIFRGRGATALAKAADVAALIQENGINPRAWLAEGAGVLSRFRIWAYANLHDGIAAALYEEVGRRITEVTRNLIRTARARLRADVLAQVIRLAEVDLSREATTGLERMLLAGQVAGGRALDDTAAIEILQRLRAHPERVEPFLRLLKDLQSPVLDDLVTRGVLRDLAAADAALTMSGRLGPVGTGDLLRDGFRGSIDDFDAFARGLAASAEALRERAWRVLLDHPDLVATLRLRDVLVTPEGVAALGRLAEQSAVDAAGLNTMLSGFTAPQARGFLADLAAATDRRLAELAELTHHGPQGAPRYLQRQRLAGPGRVPAGPNVNLPIPADVAAPVAPAPHPNPGPAEIDARRAVPDADKVGFDIWMNELQTGGRRPSDPEAVLPTLTQEEINRRSAAFARAFRDREEWAADAARQRARYHDDPLDPQLAHIERDGNITLRYEGRARDGGRPSAREIGQAQDLARTSGEKVEIFGDTAFGEQYPGIDGVIGEPARPLSLKQSRGLANVGYARVHMRDAFEAARLHGYSHVEVHIRMEGCDIAQIRAALDAAPANARGLGPVFDAADTIAKYVFHGVNDATFVMEPPL